MKTAGVAPAAHMKLAPRIPITGSLYLAGRMLALTHAAWMNSDKQLPRIGCFLLQLIEGALPR